MFVLHYDNRLCHHEPYLPSIVEHPTWQQQYVKYPIVIALNSTIAFSQTTPLWYHGSNT